MEKYDVLLNQVEDFKVQHGYYPKHLELDQSWIPDECMEDLVLEVEHIKIPIEICGGCK